MRAIAVLVAGVLLAASAARADSKKDWDDCASNDADRSAAGCTNIIKLGKDTKSNLAIAYANRGNDYLNTDDYARAIADYTQSLKLRPDADVYNNRGAAYDDTGEFDLAIADYGQAIKLKPDFAAAFNNRGNALASKGDNDRAIADYDRAIKLKLDYPDAFNGRGSAYSNKGDYDRAIADLDQAIKLDPNLVKAYTNCGTAHFLRRDYDSALADCDRAIGLKPDLDVAHACRADALWGKDDYEGAVASYSKAIEIAGADAWGALYRARADALSNKGDFDQSIAGYDKALALDSKDEESFRNRGLTRCNKGDYDQGLADLDQALQLNPDDAKTVSNAKAWCLLQKGEVDQALAEAERAVALNPEDGGTLDTRGEVYLRKGSLDLALADFDKATSLNATLVEVYRDRGLLFEQKGDKAKALEEYRQALTLKPRWVMEHRAQDEALQRLTALATAGASAAAPVPAAAPAASPSPSEKRIALVIGNAAYTNVRGLKNSDSDARAVAASLRRLGFDVIEKHDLKLADLTAEFKDFGDKVSAYDWAVVYYAGHGIEIGGINYIIPVDAELATAAHVDDEAFPLDRVLAKVEGAHKLRLVILDACRENPFLAKMAAAGGTRSVGRGLARIEPTGGVLVAYSARDGQVAQDGDGSNSPFAQALLAHLDEPGLEINMLFRRVRDDVKSETNGEQEPFTYGSLPAEAMFFKAPAR